MLDNRILRSLVLNVFLYASVIFSHHLGGGTFSVKPVILISIALSISYFSFKPINEFKGPQLAAALVIFQLIGHLLFSENSLSSGVQMYLSHCIAVFLTYYLAQNFEKVLLSIDGLIDELLRKLVFIFPQLKIQSVWLKIHTYFLELSFYSVNDLNSRAPPALRRA
jgi:hypothetical protein